MGIIYDICADNNINMFYCNEEDSKVLLKNCGGACAYRHICSDGSEEKFIAIDEKSKSNKWERRFLAAHELAHLLYGHLGNFELCHEQKEHEAQTFASAFVALMLYDEYKNKAVTLLGG